MTASLSVVSIAAVPEAGGRCGDSRRVSEGLDSFPREAESEDTKPGLVSCNERFLNYGGCTAHGTQGTSTRCPDTSQILPQGGRRQAGDGAAAATGDGGTQTEIFGNVCFGELLGSG